VRYKARVKVSWIQVHDIILEASLVKTDIHLPIPEYISCLIVGYENLARTTASLSSSFCFSPGITLHPAIKID
jgi:hypothetical protein